MQLAQIDAPPFLLRHIKPSDRHFVFDSWTKSYRKSPTVQGLESEIYYPRQMKIITRLLERGWCMIMADPQDPDHIIGYCAGEHTRSALVIHWMFIKKNFRRFGLARTTLNLILRSAKHDAVLIASHNPGTPFLKRMQRDYPITYDPAAKD